MSQNNTLTNPNTNTNPDHHHHINYKHIYVPIGVVVAILFTIGTLIWSISNQFSDLKIFISENLATKVELSEIESNINERTELLDGRIRTLESNQAVIMYRVQSIEEENKDE